LGEVAERTKRVYFELFEEITGEIFSANFGFLRNHLPWTEVQK